MIKNPPQEDELLDLAKKANKSAIDLVNKKSKAYKELNVNLESLSDEEIIKELIKNPKAIKRPIITNGEKVVIGFLEEEIENNFSN